MIIKKIINKIINLTFELFNAVSYSDYIAAKTNRSFDSMSSILLWMMSNLKQRYPDFEFNGAKVAEIGTGKFLSHPVGFLVLGANKVTTFDLYRQLNQKVSNLSFSQNVMAKKIFSTYVSSDYYFKVINEIKLTKFDLIKLEKKGIEYKAPFDIHNYKTENDFDLIASYTVLEHVPPDKVESLLIKSINILKPGGKFCHYIDLEDHLDSESNPFKFLAREDWGEQDCFMRGNRLRFNDWQNIFNNIPNIHYEFASIIRREACLIPDVVRSKDGFDENNVSVTGILVIGNKTD